MERLKGKTILIGKEPGQGRLLIAVEGVSKAAALGAPGSVPGSVSRCKVAEGVSHAKISVDANCAMTLTNVKPQNVTYVNGTPVMSKRVTPEHTVELGKDRYAIHLPAVIDAAKNLMPAPKPPEKKFNIKHLERVWEDYDRELENITKKQQDHSRKRMLPIMIGSASGVATTVLAAVSISAMWVTLPLAVLSFGLYFMMYRRQDTSFQDKKRATERFTENYVCPNPDCGKFFGNMSYKLLKSQFDMHCPKCKCTFVEK